MKYKTSPRIRFSQFIEDWRPVSLKDITLLITKGTTPSYFTEEGIRYIKIESLKNNTVDNSQCLYIDDKTHEGPLRRSILKENDLLFAIAGATIGKCCIIPKESLPANTNQALSIIRLSQHQNNKFVFFNLQSNKMQRYIKDNISVGAQPNLNLEQIGKFSFYTPALEEQTKIANFLSAVDSKITSLERLVSHWQAYKKSIMQQIFTQQLRFKGYADKWKSKQINDICPLQRGFDLPNDKITEGIYPVAFSNGILKYHNEFKVKGPGVVTGRSGTIGKVTFVNSDFWPHNTTLWVTNFKGNNPLFIYYLLNNIGLERFSAGSSVPTLNRNDVHSFTVHIPCYEEQTKIATFLSSLDDKIAHLQQQLTSYRQFKKALLQQMFV